jgi:hypothetical protein
MSGAAKSFPFCHREIDSCSRARATAEKACGERKISATRRDSLKQDDPLASQEIQMKMKLSGGGQQMLSPHAEL